MSNYLVLLLLLFGFIMIRPGVTDEHLEIIINPEIGILSYIGDAHAEGFENIHQKINEKLQLFTSSKVLIYCSENKLINECIDLFVNNVNKKIQSIWWNMRNKEPFKY